MEAYIDGQRVVLDQKNFLNEGGEAKVYVLQGKAIKVYHPQSLSKRKEEKLRAFPGNLPARLVAPLDIVTDKRGKFIGFSMRFVKDAESFIMLSNKKFRENFPDSDVVKIFQDALATLKGLHKANVAIGDLNDLNLLFKGGEAIFIDADSMQFGSFPCEVATEQFLDPRLYGANFSARPMFTPDTDYYSFSVLLFKSLLLVSPFGGVHQKYPTLARRAEKRISVFNPEVKYPKAATPFKVLPDELLDHFQKVFEKDKRGVFPENLLSDMRWTKCTSCGGNHARPICPFCALKAPAAIREKVLVNRKCIADILFRTKGRIIIAKMEGGRLKYVYEEGKEVKRENGRKVMVGNPDNFTRFAIMGQKTVIGRKRKLIVVDDEKVEQEIETGMLGNLPVFDATTAEMFSLKGDMLIKGENKIVGNILENQTWFKVGPEFGFGFYRAGMKTVYFVFDIGAAGLNDSVALPQIKGQLIDAECVFSETHFLFQASTMEDGKLWNTMHLGDRSGRLVASLKEEAVDSKILSGIRNKALGGDKIIVATDEGLALLAADNGTIREAKAFPDTEPFVDDSMQLFTAPDGIYAVSEKEIKLLKLV